MVTLHKYRVFIKYCVFFKNSRNFATSPSPTLDQPMTVHIALRALKVSYSDVGEGGVGVNCEKNQFFLNTLYLMESMIGCKLMLRSFFLLLAKTSAFLRYNENNHRQTSPEDRAMRTFDVSM